MNENLKSTIRKVAQYPILESPMRAFIQLLVQCNPKLGNYFTGDYLQFPIFVNPNIAKLLDEIPSETSPRERRFLYKFFSTVWSGQNDVIEIGPFLGGTTRAIALGMGHNPRVSKSSMLHTYDRFYGYYDFQSLSEYLHPLVNNGTLTPSDLDNLGKSGNFIDVFEQIHKNHEYYNRIVPASRPVPDRKKDLLNQKMLFQIDDGILTDAVFIDGCKSWFGTKYFMSEVCKVTEKGTYFIFQDYAWYTCFWIPAFIELLKDHFQIIGYVDTTYVFMLTKRLDLETINARYPDEPSDLGEDNIMNIFNGLIEDATDRSDYFAVVRHTLQRAGALAYVGNTQKAKEIILNLRKKSWATSHKKIIAQALRSPTYHPDGQIFL